MKRCWHKESKLLSPYYLDTETIGLYPRAPTSSASPTSKESGVYWNSWASKTNRLKTWINLVQLGGRGRCKPPCFSCLLLSQKLRTSAGTPPPSISQGLLTIYSQQISSHQPLPELSEMTLWLPHLRLRSQAFPSVPRLQVLWKVPVTSPPPPQMLIISPTAKISFFAGLRLLPIRVGKMKGKQIHRHGWK